MIDLRIVDINVRDIRFPTSKHLAGSDAMHSDPDYSCTYVILITSLKKYKGYGLTFTLGRGNEIVVEACHCLFQLIKGYTTTEIYSNFAKFWRILTSDSQLRWIGPEKGVIHLATAAIVNALWDLWARIENKPVWKLLVDMTPEQLVSTVDFRYITDMVTEESVIKKLKQNEVNKKQREQMIRSKGYPAYTTQAGWLGYTDEKVSELCRKAKKEGFKGFKLKVGKNLKDDIKRCNLVRNIIGYKNNLMLDANQVWEVNEAITWMKQLAKYKPLWIEEPTSPDDALGHKFIRENLQSYGIRVASGEMCANRVMFKQFIKSNALDFCQVDAARIGGVNELLGVYFMAHEANIPVCPHAGGIGLGEMIQHLQIWDYICLSQTDDNRMIEYVAQQHKYFQTSLQLSEGKYLVPLAPGYSTKLNEQTIKEYVQSNNSNSNVFKLYQNVIMLKKRKINRTTHLKLKKEKNNKKPKSKKKINSKVNDEKDETKDAIKDEIKNEIKDEIKDK